MYFKINSYTINNIDDIVMLHFDFKKEYELNHETYFYKTNKEVNSIFKSFLVEKIGDSEFKCLVACNDNGKVIGYITGFIQYRAPIYELQRYGWLSNLFLQFEYRNKGIAKALYLELETWFKAKAVDFIEVSRNTASLKVEAYYKKLGFNNIVTHMVKPLQNI